MKKVKLNDNNLVLTRDQVRAVDKWAINNIGIPGVALMENAGRSCAELIIDELSSIADAKVCIFCGTGNNGGDGFVIARHLLNQKFNVTVVICGDIEKIKGDAKINLNILKNMSLPINQLNITDEISINNQIEHFTKNSNIIVDAIFGTGLKGNLRQPFTHIIDEINSQNIPILAVDIPSGLDCDTGQILGTSIKARYTVTFVAVKKGFLENKSAIEYTGDSFVASIGIEPPGDLEKLIGS